MKRKYYEIYEALYTDYLNDFEYRRRRLPSSNEYKLVRTIRQSIDKANKENILRPDSKLFLIVNYHHLIVRPLIDERPPRRDFPDDKELLIKLESSIQTDINTIISESRDIGNQEEISGHQVMRTIDKLWETLKTTKLEIWG